LVPVGAAGAVELTRSLDGRRLAGWGAAIKAEETMTRLRPTTWGRKHPESKYLRSVVKAIHAGYLKDRF
jgi:hypothetical protein